MCRFEYYLLSSEILQAYPGFICMEKILSERSMPLVPESNLDDQPLACQLGGHFWFPKKDYKQNLLLHHSGPCMMFLSSIITN